MSTTARCKDCGLPIRFVRTETGKQMPLDERPTKHGDVVVDFRGGGRVVRGPEREAMRRSEGLLHVRHHNTCPAKGAQLNLGGA